MPECSKRSRAAAEAEIERLAEFLLKTVPDEIGEGNPHEMESAVDVAIRLIERSIAGSSRKGAGL